MTSSTSEPDIYRAFAGRLSSALKDFHEAQPEGPSELDIVIDLMRAERWRPVGVEEIVVRKDLLGRLLAAVLPSIKTSLTAVIKVLREQGFDLPE